jgi:MFS family permease
MTTTIWVFSSIVAALKKDDPLSDKVYVQDWFVYTIVLVASALNGFGSAILWVAQGKYVSLCAHEKTKGFFFSYFWLFYMSSQVFGNCIAAHVLGSED